MRIGTWNVNSLRARSEQVTAWLVERKIDVALLQETKCTDDAFPFADFAEIGYQSSHHGVNHWNGVAIVSRVGLEDVARGFQSSTEFDEPRLIAATCGGVRCWSVYVPNGRAVDDPHFGYKLKWLDQLAAELHSLSSSGTSALVAGDFNVGMADIDFYDAKRWAGKKHATAEERAGVQSAIDLGFVDLARDRYLGSKAVANRLEDVWVDRHTRDPMVVHPAKPSDHAPLIVDLL